MRAILLAAGLGTRLRPITNTIPKCLVPINGKPLIDYWLEQLTKAGIEKFLINTHYLHEQVESYIEQSKFAGMVDLVYEKELLLTGGTVIANKDFISDEPFMLVHADNLSICDYKDFINAHKNRPANTEITMMTFTTDDPKSCGVVKIDNSGIIQEFHEKVQNPPSTNANGAVYIVEASVISYMERLKKVKVDFSVDVLPYYMGRIFTYYNGLYHRDIGNIRSYELAQIETNSLYRKPHDIKRSIYNPSNQKAFLINGAHRRRYQFLILLTLMILTSMFEVISIGAVIPFLGVLIEPSNIFELPAAQPFIQFLGVNQPTQIIFPISALFAIAVLMSGAMRVLLLWASVKFSFILGVDLSVGILLKLLTNLILHTQNKIAVTSISAISIKIAQVINGVVLSVLNMISSFIIFIAIITILLVINPGASLIAILFFSLFIYFFTYM